MSMSGKIQSRIAPLNTGGSRSYNTSEASVPDDKNPDQVEFHKLLQNSNSDVARERMAKKSGDLSSAKTDEEFRKMLSDKASPQRTPKNTLGKDDFMKLFIAQMQSQDPLNPQDATQMSAQMAQFNSLEQMMNLNKTMETMLKGQSTDRAVSMVNYVGKEVDLGNGLLKWDKEKLSKSTFSIEQPLANAMVEVRDGSGQIVSQEDMGNLMPGEHNVKWAGKMKDGNIANPGIYNFAIVGKTTDGQEVTVPIKTKVKVTGIDLQSDGGAFFTEVGKIDVKDIASVGLQGFEDIEAAINTLEKVDTKLPGNKKDEQSNTAEVSPKPSGTEGITIEGPFSQNPEGKENESTEQDEQKSPTERLGQEIPIGKRPASSSDPEPPITISGL